jgi:ribokinase
MIHILGSIGFDLTTISDRLPRPGETLIGTGFVSGPGGKGANQALAARRAGAGTNMIGAVGADPYAEQALSMLREGGVDLSHVETRQTSTGIALIFVGGEGENMIVIAQGANATVTSQQATRMGIKQGDHLLMQLEIPLAAVAAGIMTAQGVGAVSILNTAPFNPKAANLMNDADITVANETEFDLACEALRLEGVDRKARMQAFAARSGKTIIVTLGGEGAIAATRSGFISVPALPITPVDTVGAGDTFCGYLGAALDAGLDLESAMRRASAAGSLACLKPGAQPAIPFESEVDAALV